MFRHALLRLHEPYQQIDHARAKLGFIDSLHCCIGTGTPVTIRLRLRQSLTGKTMAEYARTHAQHTHTHTPTLSQLRALSLPFWGLGSVQNKVPRRTKSLVKLTDAKQII